jgi:hypothetical protein
MLDTDVGGELLERIDESKRSSIIKMMSETTFAAPTLASFAIGELSHDDTRTWTYSSNGV